MNQQIARLNEINSAHSRRIIGLMSGTSVDGLDIALCEIAGSGKECSVKFIEGETIPFEESFRKKIQQVIAAGGADLLSLTNLNSLAGMTFAKHVNEFIRKRDIPSESVDLVASHGQTVFHAPRQPEGEVRNATLQIGDADHIARHTGIITISDFRQKHVAAGGEGAPLAPYGDLLVFGEDESDVILLNIGGIANFTYLPAGKKAAGLVCGDTGPGNTLMDFWISKCRPGKAFDRAGEMASEGKADNAFLQVLKSHDYFKESFPKSTGREVFNGGYIEKSLEQSGKTGLSAEDVMATLNLFTAETIAEALIPFCKKNKALKFYISGGGKHNLKLISNMKSKISDCDISFHDTAEKGIPPDMKEAVLFALLANECVAGNPEFFAGNPTFLPAISMGKISLPH